MAEALPQVRLTTTLRDGSAQADAAVGQALNTNNNKINNKAAPGTKSPGAEIDNAFARPAPHTKIHPTKRNSTFGASQAAVGRSTTPEVRRDSQLDPLTHAILKRTVNHSHLPPKMRSVASEEDSVATETAPSIASGRTSSEPSTARAENGNSVPKDKRSKTSFLSRLVASKKKDASAETNEKESEAGDKRTEGMDAHVFSQPIGYIPQFPSPPKYIKVRSHAKKEKDFSHLFLAQELRGRTGVEIAQEGGRQDKGAPAQESRVSRKDSDAIWAMEFSTDGKHLAAGGKDYVVRVWAVLSTKEDRRAHEAEEEIGGQGGQKMRLNAPVFKKRTVQEYFGHTATILDLSWSKNNFLLSSSMDKTVCLWHISRPECLCCFKHSDFVTSIQFHPRDDRFFLAGSLDSKLRFWSIPDKSVAYCCTLPEFITAVAFSTDGKTAMAGCHNGLCLFYETEGLKYQTQVHVRSTHGKNAKGNKVTGIQAINFPIGDPNGEVKILITTNDSRIRVYNLRDKGLELKLKGNENSCSQIRASFSDDAKYIICGSEDKKAYIWSTGPCETDKRPFETYDCSQAICTSAILAPTRTRQLLSASGDPLYDLCNPPPVTLVSQNESRASSLKNTEDGAQPTSSSPPTPGTTEFTKTTVPEESPAYLARCAHPDGNIIVTADYLGHIKVFRQDCAYQTRLRNNESALSKKLLGRTNSIATKTSNRSSRISLQHNNHSSERILSWRQSINSTNGSLENFRNYTNQRSISPRKSQGQMSMQSTGRHHSQSTSAKAPSIQENASQPSPPIRTPDEAQAERPNALAEQARKSYHALPQHDKETDPLMLQGDQSYMFWDSSQYQTQAASSRLEPNSSRDPYLNGFSGASSTVASSNASANGHESHLGLPVAREATNVSQLSSEEGSDTWDEAGGEVVCRRCGGTSFQVRRRGEEGDGQVLVCRKCGQVA